VAGERGAVTGEAAALTGEAAGAPAADDAAAPDSAEGPALDVTEADIDAALAEEAGSAAGEARVETG
jgi:hypothetical protein